MSNDDQGMTHYFTPEQEAREKMLPPIERDEGMDRTYIPIPGGYEIQTKGKGSTFRIAKTDGSGERYPIPLPDFVHQFLEQMAMDIRAAFEAQQVCAAQSAETIARQSDIIAKLELELGSMKSAANFSNDIISRLEAEVEHLKQINHVKQVGWDQANTRAAAAQANNVRLREALLEILGLTEQDVKDGKYHLIADAALEKPLDTSALEAYVAKNTAMINAADSLPEFLEGKDCSANIIARLEGGMLVIANRQYVGEADGWLWGVAYGSGCNLEELEPEADDDYKVIEWMHLPPAPDKQGE